ncbi:MAG: PD-(D/E)XK nuclease family protein [Treponema sp.]|nr:PD-(D/E)XK nuclease family protein [Treponema sp.]MCL2272227.1 PD-(D/E)XK nuclease family protein [Treponema sp.]
MKYAEEILLKNIDNPNSLFVFPTDTAASRWADHILRLKGGTVSMNKFTAWDKFKQDSIKSKLPNKKSIPSVLRKIFVNRLIKENAEIVKNGGTPVFTSMIREKWAAEAVHFSSWITDILPQLGSWFNKTTGLAADSILGANAEKAASSLEGDERDMFILACRYAQFLEKHSLFEPSWETPPFKDEGKEVFIFFPQSLSDYSEYENLLSSSARVKTISVTETENIKSDTFFYTNSRSEITEAALYIRTLHEKHGINWDSIAVCIGDSEDYEPYVTREFQNRNIPFVKRISKVLADYSAGSFFSGILECVSQDYPFSSLSSLLLNRNHPWKDNETINKLMEFGIKNNCICSWEEEKDGKKKFLNVWEDAFNQPYGEIDFKVKKFFFDFRKYLNALRAAPSFSELRRQYFIFRGIFLDMDKCSEETDLILSRCIAELMNLCEIEKDFPDVPALDPFLFFTEYLSEVSYLPQSKISGVNILPYRTAAASPFDCHIVLGCSQDSLSVINSRLVFLPRKKREKLGIFDEDASEAFINLHKYNSVKKTAFFCSEQSFSGFTIPHSRINAPLKPKERYASVPELKSKFAPDYYDAENSLFTEQNVFSLNDVEFPVFHENQIEGFYNWKNRRYAKYRGNNVIKWNSDGILHEYIKKIFAKNMDYPGKYSVSSSSLDIFVQCPLKWLFERGLNLEGTESDAALMAHNITGIVYHEILNRFLSEHKNNNKILLKPSVSDQKLFLPDEYKTLLESNITQVFSKFPKFYDEEKPKMSPLTARLLQAGKKQFQFSLENCLSGFLSLFCGCYVKDCEISLASQHGNYYLNGKIDCILKSPENEYIIVDFKTKKTPKRTECTGEGDNGLSDFQLPMYITLAQENEEIKISSAVFFSILDQKPEVIIGAVTDNIYEVKIPKKEEDRILPGDDKYMRIFDDFNQKVCEFSDNISSGNFTVPETKYSRCSECSHNRICRTFFIINRGSPDG